MTYNLTIVTENSTNILSMIQAVNSELTFGWMGVLILLGLTFVFFSSMYFSTQDAAKSAAGTSFIMLILTLFFRAINLAPDLALYIAALAMAGSLAFAWKREA